MNREGELVPTKPRVARAERNVSGCVWPRSVIVAYGVMIALNPWLPRVSGIGSFLVS